MCYNLKQLMLLKLAYFVIKTGFESHRGDKEVVTMKNRILIIDDDIDLCKLLQENLLEWDYEVDVCHDGQTGIAKADEENYQLIILDVIMPGLDGFDVLELIRKKENVPILMLTARDDCTSKVNGLHRGADDYLTKPFDLDEFNARVESLIRRYVYFNEPTPKEVIKFDRLTIIMDGKIVKVDGRNVTLSSKEFDLLIYFAQNAEKILSKKRIYEAVWQQPYMYDDSTIMTTMSRLRKKLDSCSGNISYIETVKGMGYRFKAKPRENTPTTNG